MSAEITDEAAWAWWQRQCAAQGLSPKIEDPAIIARVVTLASPEIHMTDEELDELQVRWTAAGPRRGSARKGEAMNAPKVGTCYCGCGQYTGGWWAAGHDQRAVAWLDQLDPEPANRAARVLLAGYGPSGRNLQDAARAAGLIEDE